MEFYPCDKSWHDKNLYEKVKKVAFFQLNIVVNQRLMLSGTRSRTGAIAAHFESGAGAKKFSAANGLVISRCCAGLQAQSCLHPHVIPLTTPARFEVQAG
jgi:hypothetical protein